MPKLHTIGNQTKVTIPKDVIDFMNWAGTEDMAVDCSKSRDCITLKRIIKKGNENKSKGDDYDVKN